MGSRFLPLKGKVCNYKASIPDPIIDYENGSIFEKSAILFITRIQEAKDFLLFYGNREDRDGNTPLHWAIFGRNEEIVKFILDRDFPNAHQENMKKETPLYWAAKNNFKEIIKLLESDIEKRE